jgi:hypothetical protein
MAETLRGHGLYGLAANRQAWEQVQRENGDPVTEEAWQEYLKFVRAIFGVRPHV